MTFVHCHRPAISNSRDGTVASTVHIFIAIVIYSYDEC